METGITYGNNWEILIALIALIKDWYQGVADAFDELEVAYTRVNEDIDDVPNGSQNDNKSWKTKTLSNYCF